MELDLQPEMLPPPPKTIPLDVVPIRIVPPKESPVMEIAKPKAAPVISHRPGLKGRRVCLLTNFFKVTVAGAMDDFYHYDVCLFLA